MGLFFAKAYFEKRVDVFPFIIDAAGIWQSCLFIVVVICKKIITEIKCTFE